ncbi:MAG: C4-type zinc ribbon domain-containing protein [Candidatus Omnitrophota bacterium]|jgi:hypothetical protein
MENLEEQIKLLVELQGLDSQIFKLEDQLESIPITIKNSEDAFKGKGLNLKRLEDETKAFQMKGKEKQGDLDAKEGVIKKYQSQLNQVKTNKEYTALQEEIGRVRADNSIIEEEILNIFDKIDAGNSQIKNEKDFLKAEEAKLGEEKKRLNEDALRIKTELDGFNKQRSGLAARIDKATLSKYERIIKNKDGLAVVPVSGDACQGCFRVMPPQVINEIRMKKGLVFCDSCARILYIEE